MPIVQMNYHRLNDIKKQLRNPSHGEPFTLKIARSGGACTH